MDPIATVAIILFLTLVVVALFVSKPKATSRSRQCSPYDYKPGRAKEVQARLRAQQVPVDTFSARVSVDGSSDYIK